MPDGISLPPHRSVGAGFLMWAAKCGRMKSVQKGLRDGDIEKDVYDRLVCAECSEQLKTENDPDEIGSVRICPNCEREWQQLG